ncbi:MAG: polysaccharide biosynthesis/export family protein [Kiritimatiellae bacterium]|nr:polysaccharide biosynthesis/export family protein [Kiritimatiellia bacterium]
MQNICMLMSGYRMVRLLAYAGIILTIGQACSHQDFGRPIPSPLLDAMDSGKPYVNVDYEAQSVARVKKMAKALEAWQSSGKVEDKRYDIGCDDVLEISVLSLEKPGQVTSLKRTVSDKGELNLPLLGIVQAKGMTAVALGERINKAYTGRFIKNTDVVITVLEYRSAAVVVTGAVSSPGVYYLRHNRGTVLGVLSEANSLKAEAGDTILIIRSGEKKDSEASGKADLITVDLKQLADAGDYRLNVWVQAGDIISVPSRESSYIYVLGYVQRPGGFEMPGGERMDALQAVAMAGGLAGAARAENTFLVRETSSGQRIIPVDLTKIARGTRPSLLMERGDTLVVGSGLWARLAEFLRPSIPLTPTQ